MLNNADIDLLIDKYRGRIEELLNRKPHPKLIKRPSETLEGMLFIYEIVIDDLKTLLKERSFNIVENKKCEEKELLHF